MKGPLLGLASLVATPVLAQGSDHSMHSMSGMRMPAKPAPKPDAREASKPITAKRATPRRGTAPQASKVRPPAPAPAKTDHPSHGGTTAPAAAVPHAGPRAGHHMSSMPGMDAGSMPIRTDITPVGRAGAAKVGTDLAPGKAPAPAPQPDHLADRFWGGEAMARSRKYDLRREHGGMTYYQVLMNIAEYQVRKGRDGYRWDGQGWIGGDIDRLTIKGEGEGTRGRGLESGEVQALYSHALDPYWNLQVGVRHDVSPDPARTYATIGIEGLAPYWFDVEGAVFVSDKGDVLARAEAWYDQRLTQFVVLQPRIEANVALQNVRETATGAGLTDLELGLRLRYEKSRRLAPYVGVSWEGRLGHTAHLARTRGIDVSGLGFVAGMRAWF
ncbi:copper resistance protein B [Sphingomonas sp. RHCKR7]|uniref:copper resistance protein B n=1 Tax=Sphingomonas folli TaxID=2862497 RepID=UPI001CA51C23|nr:copper resistance protein B [Sphingomonas folli]MBW6525250.1 copper resistance protein B [Sphingomonas folli]